MTPNWASIRELYANHDHASYNPYLMDWLTVFSPIEYMAWDGIRNFGLPMYPQFPVLNFFVDFGDPIKKIAVECDGKDFHDEEKDRARDIELAKIGWVVYRITGKECNKIPLFYSDLVDCSHSKEDIKNAQIEYLNSLEGTSDLVIESIAIIHYDCATVSGLVTKEKAESVLSRHRGFYGR